MVRVAITNRTRTVIVRFKGVVVKFLFITFIGNICYTIQGVGKLSLVQLIVRSSWFFGGLVITTTELEAVSCTSVHVLEQGGRA